MDFPPPRLSAGLKLRGRFVPFHFLSPLIQRDKSWVGSSDDGHSSPTHRKLRLARRHFILGSLVVANTLLGPNSRRILSTTLLDKCIPLQADATATYPTSGISPDNLYPL